MRVYKNSETSSSVSYFILIITIIISFIGGIFILAKLLKGFILIVLSIILVFFLYFVYRYFKKKIIIINTIILYTDYFKINGRSIPFKSILSYKITYFGGASLKIHFKDNSKLKLLSNKSLSINQNFNDFCFDLEENLTLFSLKNHQTPKRIKGFYEKKAGWYFTYILTFSFIIVIIHSFITNKELNPSFFVSFTCVGTLWSALFTEKRIKR